MRAFRIIICGLSAWLSIAVASAQDVLITKDGDAMKVWGVELSGSSVFYRESEAEDSPIKRIKKDDLLMVKYQNGEKVIIGEEDSQATQAGVQTDGGQAGGVVHVTHESLSDEAKAANDAYIAKINVPVELVLKEKYQKYIGKKNANSCFACFGVMPNSILCNEDIVVNIEIGTLSKASKNSPAEWKEKAARYYTTNPAIRFSIKNNSRQTIYLDLANTFYVTMGQSTCYYIPSSTTTSNTSSGGAGVNLGAVTGALGIGGVAGTLANGINVGGGSSSMTSSTTYSQRIVAIAPSATVNLSPQYLFCNEYKWITKGLQYDLYPPYTYYAEARFPKKSQTGPMMFGDHYTYSDESSPLKFSFFVAYAKSEDCASTKVLQSHFYLKDMLGDNGGNNNMAGWSNINNSDIPYIRMVVKDYGGSSFPKE